MCRSAQIDNVKNAGRITKGILIYLINYIYKIAINIK